MMLPAFTKKSELGISCESREHHGSAEAVLFDRKSTRLNSSHGYISYPVFCLKKKGLPPPSPRERLCSRWCCPPHADPTARTAPLCTTLSPSSRIRSFPRPTTPAHLSSCA